MILWFIGQPQSGKTTLAKYLQANPSGLGRFIHFDGDDLRKIFGNNSYSPETFTREWREEQTRILQKMVAYIADQGFSVIVSTVNPYRNVREEFKNSRSDVIEIYVHKSVARDREKFNVSDYEIPEKNFVDIDTTEDSIKQSFKKLYDNIYGRRLY